MRSLMYSPLYEVILFVAIMMRYEEYLYNSNIKSLE